MRREVLGFNHQEGRVGIQSLRGKGWDSIIKREGLHRFTSITKMN
jgi:hypothetical protein